MGLVDIKYQGKGGGGGGVGFGRKGLGGIQEGVYTKVVCMHCIENSLLPLHEQVTNIAEKYSSVNSYKSANSE